MNSASRLLPPDEFDPRTHLREEMARVAALLGRLLQRSRERGRSPADESLQGYVIEDGEAEGIARDLSARWSAEVAEPAAGPPTVWDRMAERHTGIFLPLRHAVRNFELGPVEDLAMLLALAVEMDGQFGRLVAYLNDHVGRTRPTIGLALNLFGMTGAQTALSPLSFCNRPAVRDGLLELEGDGPVPGLALRVPRHMASRLAAEAAPETLPPGFRYFPAERGLLQRLVLDDEPRRRLAAWSGTLRLPGRGGPLILTGSAGAGRTTAARGAVSELGWPLLAVDLSAFPFADRLLAARREARWHGAPLLVRIAASIVPGQVDWRAFWASLADLRVPLMIATLPDTAVALAAAAETEPAVIAISEPDFAARATLWRMLGPSTGYLRTKRTNSRHVFVSIPVGSIGRCSVSLSIPLRVEEAKRCFGPVATPVPRRWGRSRRNCPCPTDGTNLSCHPECVQSWSWRAPGCASSTRCFTNGGLPAGFRWGAA